MVLMRDDGDEFEPHGHWIVVVDKKGPVFTYLDPWYKGDSGENVRQIEEAAFLIALRAAHVKLFRRVRVSD